MRCASSACTLRLPSVTPYSLQPGVQIINVQRQTLGPHVERTTRLVASKRDSLIHKELNLLCGEAHNSSRDLCVPCASIIAQEFAAHVRRTLQRAPKPSTQNFGASCNDRTTKAVCTALHMTKKLQRASYHPISDE